MDIDVLYQLECSRDEHIIGIINDLSTKQFRQLRARDDEPNNTQTS